MVGNLTTGKKKYAEYEEDIQRILGEAQALQDQLMAMIDQDAENFAPLDRDYVASVENELKPMLEDGIAICDTVYAEVEKQLS